MIVVLRRQSFRENDTRVLGYSPAYGKIDLVARGTKKMASKLRSHLEPFTVVNVMVVRGKKYDYVGAAEGIDFFQELKSDYQKVIAAGEAMRIFDKLIDYGDQIDAAKIYEILNNYLDVHRNSLVNVELAKYHFLWKILMNIGFRPELESCNVCTGKGAEAYFFNPLTGLLICNKCVSVTSGLIQVKRENLAILRQLEPANYEEIMNITEDQVFEICRIVRLFLLNQIQ